MRGISARTAAAVAVTVLLAGCANPVGGVLEECEPTLEAAGILAPEPGVQTAADTTPIECYRIVRDSRLEVLFTMPPGPDCYGVSIVDAVESGDAISVELRVGALVNPLAGACPETETVWAVQVELNGPIGDRQVLDRARPSD